MQNDTSIGSIAATQPLDNTNFSPFMLILIGIPGSGKSTFANLLVTQKPWMYVRVSQDVLGSSSACLQLARSTILDGKCPVIDRCNFDTKQRAKFLKLASINNLPVDCVVFRFPSELCISRCQDRSDHETLTPEMAPRIVKIMEKQFSPPQQGRKVESCRKI